MMIKKVNTSYLLLAIVLILISLILLTSFLISKNRCFLFQIISPSEYTTTKTSAKVPPTLYSHQLQCNCCGLPNTWSTIPNKNKPGILPGSKELGDDLGLNSNSVLSLKTPIKAPLLQTRPALLNQPALQRANRLAKMKTMNASAYYKYRFQECSPYNGNYCQCTNNYIPLPNVGKCQQNGFSEDVCPYDKRLKPSVLYQIYNK